MSIAEIAGLTELDLGAASRELQAIGWVRADNDDQLAIGHRLLGQVALSLLSTAEKKSVHGRAARVLAESGQLSDARAAISYDVAGNRADAFDAAMRAVEACDTLHARTEKEFFLKLGLSNAPNPKQAGLVRIALAELLLKQRKPHEALEIVSKSFFRDVSAELQSRAEAARVKVEAEMANEIGQLRQLWDRAEIMRGDLDPLVLADTYMHLAGVSHDLGFDNQSLQIAETIAEELSDLPLDVETARHLLRPLVIIALNKGFDETLKRLEQLPAPYGHEPIYACRYHSTRASVLVAAGRLKEAESGFAESLGLAERYALVDQYFYIHNNLGVCLLEQGRYGEAEQHFKAATFFVNEGRSPSHWWVAQDNMMILEYERGNFAKALEMAESKSRARTASSIRGGMSLHSIIGLSSLEVGALGRSSEAEREIQLLMQHHDPKGNDMSYVHIFIARMLGLRRNERAAAKALEAPARHYANRNVLAFARIDLERCRWCRRAGLPYADDLSFVRDVLKTSGAVPLIERVDQLWARS